MPYIRKEDRTVRTAISPRTTGELNYAITKLCHEYVAGHRNIFGETLSMDYDLCNSVVGVLECAKQEFYRIVVARYEDEKRKETGPISKVDA
jgi:hypothetical protein